MRTARNFVQFFEIHRNDYPLIILATFIFIVLGFCASVLLFGSSFDARSRWNLLDVAIVNLDKDTMGNITVLYLSTTAQFNFLVNPVHNLEDLKRFIDDGHAFLGLFIGKNFTKALDHSADHSVTYERIGIVFDEGRVPNLITQMRLAIAQSILNISKIVSTSLIRQHLQNPNGSKSDEHSDFFVDPIQLQPINLHPIPSLGVDNALVGMVYNLFTLSIAFNSVIFALYKPLDMISKPDTWFILRIIPDFLVSLILALVSAAGILVFGLPIVHSYIYMAMFLFLMCLCFNSIVFISFAAFGPIGLLFLIFFVPLQVATSGGNNPLILSHEFFYIGYGLPIYNAIEGCRHLLYGSYNNLNINVVVLITWWFVLTEVGELYYKIAPIVYRKSLSRSINPPADLE